MRALILCQGPGWRWGDYLGGPKQLAVHFHHPWQRCLETPPQRLVRQLVEQGVHDIIIVAPDDRYVVPGAQLVTLEQPDTLGCDMSKLDATAPLWADQGHTALLWGDTYLDDAVVAEVAGWAGPYNVWRRPGPSAITGHGWDESFAVVWPAEQGTRVLEVARHVAEVHHRGGLRRGTHVRTHLAAWAGLPTSRWDHVPSIGRAGHQVHVDGWSDDFDTPGEWASWVGRRYAGLYDATVVIPWEDSGCPARAAALDLALEHWAMLGLPVVVGHDPTTGPWVNRSAARNDGARRALHDGAGVLLFADADTIVGADQAWAAVHLAAITGRAVLGFDRYVRLNGTATRRAHVDRRTSANWTPDSGRTYEHHISGALAVPAGLWRHVGGYDERFDSWGAEDRAMHATLDVLGGGVERIPGCAWHLHHPVTRERDLHHPNRARVLELALRYKRAAGIGTGHGMWRESPGVPPGEPDPGAVRAILAEPGGPGPTAPPALERPGTWAEPPEPEGGRYGRGWGPPGIITVRRREAPSSLGTAKLAHPEGGRVRLVRPESPTWVRLRAEGWRVVA